MTSEFPRYGQAEIGSAYYLVRVIASGVGPRGGYEGAATYLIDGLGHAEKIATAAPGQMSPEEIAELPTLAEAQTRHMAPAFAEAEANQRKYLAEKEKEGPVESPRPAPYDPATARFLDDGDYC